MPRQDPAERFWSKVDKSSDCWLWTGKIDAYGYGAFRLYGENLKAHRYAYELMNGAIPEGLQIHHLCRVRHCVNPSHMEAVTMEENQQLTPSHVRKAGEQPDWLNVIAAARQRSAQRQAPTECQRGHPFNETNTKDRLRNGRIHHECRVCKRIRWAAARAEGRYR